MSQQPARGISRQGLGAMFEAEDVRQSNLILEADIDDGKGGEFEWQKL